MKVGDLVIFKGDTCNDIGDPGIGTVVQYLTGGVGRKNNSAEVAWPQLGIMKWHTEDKLEVVSES